jgi:hypothetical protein
VSLSVEVSIEIPLSSSSSGSSQTTDIDTSLLYDSLSNAWTTSTLVTSPSTMIETIRQSLLNTPSVQSSGSILTIDSMDPATTLAAYETVLMPTTSPTKSPSSAKSGVTVLEWNEPVRLFDVEFGLNGLYWLLILLSITVICVAIGVILSWSYCTCAMCPRHRDRESVIERDTAELAMATDCLPMNELSANEIPLSGLPMASVEMWRHRRAIDGMDVGDEEEVIEVDLNAIRIDERDMLGMREREKEEGSREKRDRENAYDPSAPPMTYMMAEGEQDVGYSSIPRYDNNGRMDARSSHIDR